MPKRARDALGPDDAPKPKAAKKGDADPHTVQVHQEDVLRHPTIERAKEIDASPPLFELEALIAKQKTDHPVRNVLHWFRSKDLRIEDNRALNAASEKVQEGKGMLLTAYLFSPKDMEWHGTSAARSDFILETLRLMQKQLAEKNIPMVFLTAPERKNKVDVVMEFVKKHDISHVYGNLEYEVDELRRDMKMAKCVQKEDGVSFHTLHDQTVVNPGHMTTGTGKPHKVFTPFHKAWLALVAKKPEMLDIVPPPASNKTKPDSSLFDSAVPELPDNKRFLDDDERDRIRGLWPAGHAAGIERLEHFLNEKVTNYGRDRSEPALDPSSRLSAYFSSGALSVREALTAAKKHNKGKNFDGSGNDGIAAWAREIVFREFYRQMVVILPHIVMNLSNNLKFMSVEFVDDYEREKRWYEGKTGVPFVDAGMRQLNTEAYMHNRARMNTASYLRSNLMIDYRKGERYFAEHLIDWDLGNNTHGWEPGFTVFNPVVQAENHDKDGDYIRKWVPELKDVKGKAIFSPHDRLSPKEFDKLGYPRPMVDFAESKDACLKAYKAGMDKARAAGH
jgi:deoxyribodipyrimidine photo-lyase